MGSSVSRKEIEKKIEDDYKSLRKYCDDVYGDITVVQERSTGIRFALLERVVERSDEFQKRLSALEHTNGILQVHKSYCRNTDMCSHSRVFHLLVEYKQNSVEKELLHRHQQQRYFSKEEVYSLMYQTVEIVIDLKKSDREGLRLPLHNKLLALTQNLVVKTLDPILLENKEDTFEPILSDLTDRRFVFVSPQIMLLMSHNQRSQAQQMHNQEKSLVWTLGICFLEMTLLQDCSVVYNLSLKTINLEKVQQLLSLLRNVYGQDVESLISWMLQENLRDRPRLQEIRRRISLLGGPCLSSRQSLNQSPVRKQSLSLASKIVSRRGSN